MTSGGMTCDEWLAKQHKPCGRCRVLPVTMRCPVAPHERCALCWDVWMEGGYIAGRKRHPGRWSAATRVRRAVRLHKAHARRESAAMLAWLSTIRDNRAQRRAMMRNDFEREARCFGVVATAGESTSSLRQRIEATMIQATISEGMS